jgi:uncharacterized protein
VLLSVAACDRVAEPVSSASADPHPLTSTASPTAQQAPARCTKAWGQKPKREPFLPGFVAPDCPDKGDELTPPAPKDPLRTATVVFPGAGNGGAPVSATVEVADSGPARQRGLMLRKSMPENRGMLFVFQERRVQEFWMHNTCIPLDMMFIDKDGYITGIEENVPTMNDNTYTSGCAATYVLEMNAGWSRAHGVAPGQTVKFEGL